MNKRHEPTDETRRIVRVLKSAGISSRATAAAIGISEPTLNRYYREDLDLAHEYCNGEVADTLFRMAKSGRHPAATFFWLKTRAGWRETHHVDMRVSSDLSKLSDDELEAARAIAAKLAEPT